MSEAGNSAGFGVNLIAYIRAEMGLGAAARGIAHALEAASVPFNILNFEHSNPSLHRDNFWKHREVTSSDYDFTLLVINPDNLANARTRVQRKFARDRYAIGYWFWELPEIPDEWQSSFALVDEVWVASRFVQDAISRRSTLPVFRVPIPVQLGPTDRFSREGLGLPEQRFLFLSMGDTRSLIERKNLLGSVRAFKKAFPQNDESVGLVLKINNANSHEAVEEAMDRLWEEIAGNTNIYVKEADMNRSQIDALLAASNCFVSLHRSEGFGLGPAEAMSLGKPAIMTRWSGNTDYMTPTNSIGIDYQLIPVGKQRGPYAADQLWADPDVDQAAFWMNRLVREPELAQRIGREGQETIRRDFSPAAVGAMVDRRLKFLHDSGLARRRHRSRVDGPAAPLQLKTFAPRAGTSDPERSTNADSMPGQWNRVKVDLPWGLGDGSAAFRFDPVDRSGLVDIAAITLRNSATAETLWSANRRGGLDDLTIGGTALRLPHDRLLRLLSYDDDPQVYLPQLSGPAFEEPLTLEVLLRFERAPATVERAVGAWNKRVSNENSLQSEKSAPVGPAPSEPGMEETLADRQITMVVYSGSDAGYSEERSTRVSYTPHRWSHLTIALQLGLGSRPLRLDPLTAIGLIDVAALTIRSALNDEVLWRANGGGELAHLQVSGSAVRIPHPNLARILSYGDDPQLYLPSFAGGKFDGPLRLEVWLKTETGFDSIRRGISELASMGAKALGATAHTQSLLEESNRASNDKEEEMQALEARMETASRERDEALERLTEIESSSRDQLNERQRQLALRDHDLKRSRSELLRVRQELMMSRNELEYTAGELETSRAEQRKVTEEGALHGREHEKLQRDLEARSSELKNLSREMVLWRNQLTADTSAKKSLIEHFTNTAEKLAAIKKDIAVMRQAEEARCRSPIGRLLGHRTLPEYQPDPKRASKKSKSQKYAFWLDSPTGPTPAREKIFYAGWVLPAAGDKILAVRALVQGEEFLGQYGFARLDVAEMFSDRPEAAHAGFSIGIPLAVGVHEVTLQFLDSEGTWRTFNTHAQEVLPGLAPAEGPLSIGYGDHRTGEDFLGWLEMPQVEMVVEAGLLHILGWVYAKSGKIAEVVASIDNGVTGKLPYGLLRRDVAASLPHHAEVERSGFEGYLPVKFGFVGSLTLKIEAVLEDGTRTVCFQREVTVKLPESQTPATPTSGLSNDERYARWIETNKLTPYLLRVMARRGAELAEIGPLISVVVPTFNTPSTYLEALIDSMTKQLYPHWQLCFADDASTEPHVRSILERVAASDSRIDVVFRETNGHIVEASNSALSLAAGDYVGLLDHDDLLSADALLHVAEAIATDLSVDLLYTDEDKISSNGKRYDPIFKGSFSPEMALTHNYIQHFTVIRRSLVTEAGGFRQGFEGAQDLDLYLRVFEKTTPERIKHLPFVCYHWRSHPESTASSGSQKSYVFDSAQKSISEALERRGMRAARPFLPDWAKTANCCLYQLKWSPELLKQNPVTIVIPTKNHGDLLRKCVASLERTVVPGSVHLVIVDDFSEDEATKKLLAQLQAGTRFPCKVIQPASRPNGFNFSRLVNEGVAAASTSLVLLLNNDTEALAPGWLEELVGWMSIEGVGAVGAKLLYPDKTIQHAGVIVGSHGGLADHIFHGLPEQVIGFNFLSHAARNVSAVTGACLLTSKATFDEIGGFDEHDFGMEYNDVDFCLRLSSAGRRVVFTPQSVLLHYCGQSRGSVEWRPAEHLNFLRRYGSLRDPYYNENLDLNQTSGLVDRYHFLHKNRVGRLRVLMISHNLNLEGAPRVLFDHAAYFTKTGGYDVTVISRLDGPLRGSLEDAGIRVKIVEAVTPGLGEEPSVYKERLRETGAELNLESFDLVVCNTLTSFWGVTLAEVFDLPVIWHVHESTTIEQFFRFDAIPVDLVESCFASADRVVFEASSTRRLLGRYQKRDNFETIPGSIDVGVIDRFREEHSQAAMKLKHGLDPEKMVVTLIGTACPRKAQHVFIEAIRHLQENNPDRIGAVCFVMLGARQSAYLELLRSQLKDIAETDTRLLEESADVFDFYRLTDIFLCASFQESFPRVILEAMAFKLPIISTDVFGIPEMVKHQGEALLVSPGDARSIATYIESLLVDSRARHELGERAHAKVTRLFNSRTQLKRQFDLTKEVVAQHLRTVPGRPASRALS